MKKEKLPRGSSRYADRLFGAVLKEARLEKGLSLRRLGSKVPCSRQTLFDYEKGVNYPAHPVLVRICYLLGLDEREMRILIVKGKVTKIRNMYGFK